MIAVSSPRGYGTALRKVFSIGSTTQARDLSLTMTEFDQILAVSILEVDSAIHDEWIHGQAIVTTRPLTNIVEAECGWCNLTEECGRRPMNIKDH